MKNYLDYLGKRVRIITMVMFKNGRRIKTDYIGELVEIRGDSVIILESDNQKVDIKKRFIKRIEEP